MRVRCRFCGAEYDTPVTRAALLLVDRCEHCGRAGLSTLEPPEDDVRRSRGDPDPPVEGDAPP